MKKGKNVFKYYWILGFLGFNGLSYFKTGDPSRLFWVAYFSFFAYPLICNILGESEDERMLANRRRSNALALKVALLFLLTIGLAPTLEFVEPTETFFMAMSALGVGLTVLTQIFSFYYFERYSKD